MASTAVELMRRRFGGGSNIIYQASNITFDGSNYVDTGIKLLEQGDFKIEMELTLTDVSRTMNLISCRNTSAVKGLDIRLHNKYLRPVLNNTGYNVGSQHSVGDIVDFIAVKIGSSVTVTSEGSSISGTVTDVDKNLYLGSQENGANKAKYILNSILITKI